MSNILTETLKPNFFEGYAKKKGKWKYNKRWFIVKDNKFYYCNDKNSKEVKGCFTLNSNSKIENKTNSLKYSSDRRYFELSLLVFNDKKERTFILRLDDEDTFSKFSNAIDEAIKTTLKEKENVDVSVLTPLNDIQLISSISPSMSPSPSPSLSPATPKKNENSRQLSIDTNGQIKKLESDIEKLKRELLDLQFILDDDGPDDESEKKEGEQPTEEKKEETVEEGPKEEEKKEEPKEEEKKEEPPKEEEQPKEEEEKKEEPPKEEEQPKEEEKKEEPPKEESSSETETGSDSEY